MKWAVVADSASDMACLKAELDGEVGFDVVPLKISVGDKEFVDDESLDVDYMMQCLSEYKGKSGSAAPSPADWKKAFEMADNVIAFTISGNLSGSYRSAAAARDMVLEQHPDKNILIIDTLSTGAGMILLIRKAMELAKKNVSMDEMEKAVREYRKKTHLHFILENMDNLIKNGRVSKFEGGVAAILGIKVLGEASPEGTLHMLKKARGRNMAYDKMIDCMLEKNYNGGPVIIGHCNNEDKAAYIKSKLKQKFEEADIEIMRLRGLDSFYAEKGGIILGFEF